MLQTIVSPIANNCFKNFPYEKWDKMNEMEREQLLQEAEAENISDLSGLNDSNPWYAALLAIAMFSMAGVPPTVGFYAKLTGLCDSTKIERAPSCRRTPSKCAARSGDRS